MASRPAFQTLFAVPLSYDGCVKAVSDQVYQLDGIIKVEGNIKDQLISVQGTVAPSAIAEAIRKTGRDAILRGSGASNSAAVCILEIFADTATAAYQDRVVRGLARMIQVDLDRTLIDLTVHGLPPGCYRASVREYGDVKEGVKSTGPVWRGGREEHEDERGRLGVIEVGDDGRGTAFVDRLFQISEVIGHALALTRQDESAHELENDDSTVVGVIARSAGVWDNDKTVCSCTGKTLWEERKAEVEKGML